MNYALSFDETPDDHRQRTFMDKIAKDWKFLLQISFLVFGLGAWYQTTQYLIRKVEILEIDNNQKARKLDVIEERCNQMQELLKRLQDKLEARKIVFAGELKSAPADFQTTKRP